MRTQAIEGAAGDPFDVSMEYITGAFRQADPPGLGTRGVEQAKFDRGGMSGEHRDIHAIARKRDAQRFGGPLRDRVRHQASRSRNRFAYSCAG